MFSFIFDAFQAIPTSSFIDNNVIQVLYIGQNLFETIHSRAFHNLKHLKRLYISNSTFLTVRVFFYI